MLEKQLLMYQRPNGSVPFEEWLYGDRLDKKSKGIVIERIHRLSLGNPGYWSPVGEGVYEMKADFGPGYRIYYAHAGKSIVVLLCGGDKKSQRTDIQTARRYWKDFQRRNRS